MRSIVPLTLLCIALSTGIHAQQITDAPSPDHYRAAVLRDTLRRRAETSLGSADALTYCQESAPGCSAQLTLFDACQSEYGNDNKYLYCLCTTGYHSAVSNCDACSVSLGAIPTSYLTLEVANDNFECNMWYSSFGSPSATVGGNAQTTKKVSAKETVTSASPGAGLESSGGQSSSSSSRSGGVETVTEGGGFAAPAATGTQALGSESSSSTTTERPSPAASTGAAVALLSYSRDSALMLPLFMVMGGLCAGLGIIL